MSPCQPGGKDLPRSRFNSAPGRSPLVTISSTRALLTNSMVRKVLRSTVRRFPGCFVRGAEVPEDKWGKDFLQCGTAPRYAGGQGKRSKESDKKRGAG
jgi:hypothetical protein